MREDHDILKVERLYLRAVKTAKSKRGPLLEEISALADKICGIPGGYATSEESCFWLGFKVAKILASKEATQ